MKTDKIPCPIQNCTHIYHGGITGWFMHVAVPGAHPTWYPETHEAEVRAQLFRDEYPDFFTRKSRPPTPSSRINAPGATTVRPPPRHEPVPMPVPLNKLIEAAGAYMLVHDRTAPGPIGYVVKIGHGWSWEDYRNRERSTVLYATAGDALNAFLFRSDTHPSTRSVSEVRT